MRKNPFNELLAKEMTRREFLQHVGFLLLVITGLSGIVKTLSDPHLIGSQTKASQGFGSGPYGG